MTNIVEIKAGLEGLKLTVSSLKDRASKLALTREGLIRQAATQEQTQAQALAELKELGIVPANLEPGTLEALAEKAAVELNKSVVELEKAVADAEQLSGQVALGVD